MMEQEMYNVQEALVRQTFVSVVWTHKIQEKQGDTEASRFHWMEVANIVCASLTSAGIVVSIFEEGVWLKIITAAISFVTVFCGAYFKSFDVKNTIAKHRATACKLVAIRNELLVLLADVKFQRKPIETLEEEYKVLLKRLHTIYDEAPATTKRAVAEAQNALNVDKEYTYSDAEIDKFLPAELQKECHV